MNAIVDQIQTMGEAWEQYKTANDERLEAIEKGNVGRAGELNAMLEKMETTITGSQAELKEISKGIAEDRARLEMLEALQDRPNLTPEEKNANDHMELFFKSLRGQFKDPNETRELKELEQKDVTIGSNIGGGFALPKQIGADIDALLLKLSDIVANVKNIRVGTSDYQELVSIHGGTSGWVGETGTRSATGTPNLRSQKPTWGELYAYPQISEWSAQDIFFNVAQWLTNDVAEGMAVALATAIWSGDGSDKPTGMTNTAPDEFPVATVSVTDRVPIAFSRGIRVLPCFLIPPSLGGG